MSENRRSSAAVLVLVRESQSAREVLLIERSETVKTHQGQVAFPGGGMEPADQDDPVQTALREFEEEIGLDRREVEILKRLPGLPTLSSQFTVVPVLGIWKGKESHPRFNWDVAEVAYAEWVSVDHLLQSKRSENGYPVFDWKGQDLKSRKVWGLTAIIFHLFFDPDAPGL